MMTLTNENTKWVLFLSCSGPQPERRHISDLAYGVFCLEKSGINPNNIHIYIDGCNTDEAAAIISLGSTYQYEVQKSACFFQDQKCNSYENLVMFVTGHGSPEGLDANPKISPNHLLTALKSSPNLKHAVVYLGQCYAGVFNYIGAGRHSRKEQEQDPDIVFIGATNLHSSISSPTSELMAQDTQPTNWVANTFLLFVFKWFSNPIDIDGDGKITIMDSYKYAGALSNHSLLTLKSTYLHRFTELQKKWEDAQNTHKDTISNNAPTLTQQAALLESEAAETNYKNCLTILHTHQECWILNAIPAQHIEAATPLSLLDN